MGTGIVGFGSRHYQYDSGHEGDTCRLGFASRKDAMALYIGATSHPELLEQLGKHKTGKGCLYRRKLDDVDAKVLKLLLDAGANQEHY